MRTINDYIGIQPFTVVVDDSPELRILANKARELRDQPFPEKLNKVKKLTLDAMVNAYEQMRVLETKGEVSEAEKFRGVVFEGHPLSYALQEKAGCCRYQGALFFVLGYEADLGDQHYIQATPISSRMSTVFNQVREGQKIHTVSIFCESVKDKRYDYTEGNPKIFDNPTQRIPGLNFYLYHRKPKGLIIIENQEQHDESE